MRRCNAERTNGNFRLEFKDDAVKSVEVWRLDTPVKQGGLFAWMICRTRIERGDRDLCEVATRSWLASLAAADKPLSHYCNTGQ